MSVIESSAAHERPRRIAALTETVRGQLLSVGVLALVVIVLTAVAPGVWDGPWLWGSAAVVAAATGLALLGQGPLYNATWLPVLVPALDLLVIMLLLGEPSVPRIAAMLAVVPAFWLGFVGRRPGVVMAAVGGIAMGVALSLQIAGSTGTTLTANAVGAVLVPLTLVAAAFFADSYTGRLEDQQLAILERERDKTAMQRQLVADGVLLDAIFETARVGLMLLDADGEIVRANPTLSQHPALAGTSLDRVLDGARFLDLETRQPISRLEMPFLRAARGESFDNSRFWIARPGHDMFAVTVSSRPLMVDGEFRGSIASVDDVTTYMRMLEDRDDFVALISHELRTPLTSIAGYIELAMDEDMSPELRSWLKIVERNSARLRTLVEDLLIVGEMSRGELHLEPTAVDLREVAREAVATLVHRAHRRGVELRLVDGPSVPLVADPRRVSQVVENLISNGIKYTSDDGFVEVRVDVEGTDALLRVSDDGPGVEPQEASKVFERFYRSQAARASGVQGAGLGLWICRMIVQAHGGAIAFDSEVGAGSVATVRLPAA
ncbi:sensor histidine kinase [Agrococcus sp. DT81.2]|uniref:sensor histidine kinase n=1 Tax=Agrococcus sp. DT81.2 TaxID=3393414 RepID=UPI003CE4D525